MDDFLFKMFVLVLLTMHLGMHVCVSISDDTHLTEKLKNSHFRVNALVDREIYCAAGTEKSSNLGASKSEAGGLSRNQSGPTLGP